MGKHEPMTAKAIANKIKAKGLQKIKYYCERCKKQCRDANGFKCHLATESHRRQLLVVAENPQAFVNEYSKNVQDGFMFILRARYRTKRVLANTVFQEYIKDREHVHLNSTRWTSLTEFAKDLGEQGLVTVDDSERGIMVTYIDNDAETLRRKKIEAERAVQKEEEAKRKQKEIERQRAIFEEVCKKSEKEKPAAEPVPIVQVAVDSSDELDQTPHQTGEGKKEDDINQLPFVCDKETTSVKIMERPMFGVGAISLKAPSSSTYKPPPPKRKLLKKSLDPKKKAKSS